MFCCLTYTILWYMHTYGTVYAGIFFDEKIILQIVNLAGFATGFEILKINEKEGGGRKKKLTPPYVFKN